MRHVESCVLEENYKKGLTELLNKGDKERLKPTTNECVDRGTPGLFTPKTVIGASPQPIQVRVSLTGIFLG